ncbi:YdiU family protein [Candidatus Mycobacterium wuenschmannii]|uniref:Protein nucleotidyltransferase YdiU n=1 Tax=Candidatus Mycobacterium wuenschmannii TaxID=3027808 RepID=A0ABY8W0T5_9MYCO|nr:YdiU family protein [Candidatus Mycobacterium wuenschmannii]WIM88057.1 YdiU family protein [Candidatus Mycobacterium wuenschmannii]
MSVVPDTTVALQDRFATDLPELVVSWQAETFPDPRLLAFNEPLAEELGLDPEWLQGAEGRRFLVGNHVPDGAAPVAQAYAGHQFGGYIPRLGDGRALLLGELADPDGRLRDIHLKGSGPTPFARGGDGLAAVGPMLREYIVSEAMHALGVPTTRSLAVLSTGRLVQRETALPGAVLTRVAASHLRVGSFEFASSTRDLDLLRRLADHAIARHYPGAAMLDNPYLALFEAVAAVQASLVAQWMLVGFVHGVMNTDNMTISGETIDYGPCAFMEAYNPDTVFSSIDQWGRYAYDNQPTIAGWNLARFAESLLPLLADTVDEGVALAQRAFQVFRDQYDSTWTDGMRAKLGLPEDVEAPAVAELSEDLLTLLKDGRVDYTSFFRQLSTGADRLEIAGIDAWVARWRSLNPDAALMNRSNPIYIPRNHLVEEALSAATAGDLDPLRQLLIAISAPFDERPGLERYAAAAPEEFGDYRTFCGT